MRETFTVDADSALAREVVPARGDPYRHRCPLAAFEQVAHAIDDLGDRPVLLDGLVEKTGLPHTQVNVALAFLKERGSLRPAHGRCHVAAAPWGTYLDAMIEYHALREGAPGANGGGGGD